MLYTWLCVTCVVYVIRSLCDATDAAVSGTYENPSPFFLVWFVRSESIYYSIYLEIFVGTRTCKCCVALPVFKRQIFVRHVVCFFVLFMCFHTLLLTCQTVEGRYAVSRLLCCGFWGFGRQVSAASLPPSPSLRVVCLVERVTMRYVMSDRLSWEINLLCHPTPPPFLVPGVPYIIVRFVLIRCLSEPKCSHPLLCPYGPTSHPSHPSSRPLRVDVAVLSNSLSRRQDLTFS